MILEQVRECDGSCCRQSPQFPTEEGSSCKYQENNVCVLQRDNELPIEDICPVNPSMSAIEAFTEHCKNWPHSMEGRDTGNCCWQWVEG